MSGRVSQIKKMIRRECVLNGREWFYNQHLLGVEKFAVALLKKLPSANPEIVMLGVWLHDLQRIRKIKGVHEKVGAAEAQKVMRDFKYTPSEIEQVRHMILAHSCDTKIMPKTLEAKILSSADGMSHYINDFYLTIACLGERTTGEFKEWIQEKLSRNFTKKIQFPFARKMVARRHRLFKEVFTMG
jgi:HD superfamily phosphodiesterase